MGTELGAPGGSSVGRLNAVLFFFFWGGSSNNTMYIIKVSCCFLLVESCYTTIIHNMMYCKNGSENYIVKLMVGGVQSTSAFAVTIVIIDI